MSQPRRVSMPAGVAALLVLCAGCSSGPGRPGAAGGASGPPETPATPPASPAATMPPPPSPDCPRVGSAAIPDGAWNGPIAVRMRGTVPGTTTRGKGSGELQVIVEDGRVTGGTWALTWTAAGPSTAKADQATVRLRGQFAGTVTGTAAQPVLLGAWTVTGRATVTAPVTATAPIDQSGQGRAALTATVKACRTVTGRFAPSFAAADPWAASAGTARWVAHPSG